MNLEDFKYNLTRLKKCDQYWNEMQPADKGRHCSKCDKIIVDFSNMSYTDIAVFMSESKSPICGYYLPEQLQQLNHPKNKWPVTLGFSTLLMTTSVSTNSNSNKQPFENSPIEKEKGQQFFESQFENENKIIDSIHIFGRVEYFDSISKSIQPVSFASVIIKGTRNGVSTSLTGDFKLSLLPNNDSVKIILVITSISFTTLEIEIPLNGQKETNLGSIVLDKNKNSIIEFYVTVKKRSKWNKFWRKLTKPFR